MFYFILPHPVHGLINDTTSLQSYSEAHHRFADAPIGGYL